MKRIVLVSATVLLFVVGGLAQELANKVSSVYSPGAKPKVTITNNHVSPITGLVIVNQLGGPRNAKVVIWLDPAVNVRHDRPLDPGKSQTFEVGQRVGSDATPLHPEVKAAVFADGSSVGDPEWLAKLHTRRQSAFNQIGTIDALLKRALTQKQSREEIVAALQTLDTSLVRDEQQLEAKAPARLVVHTAISNLERASVGGVKGDPQKTIPVILAQFAEWRGALKQFDKTIQ